MKFLVLTLMLVGLFAVVLGGLLYTQVKISNEPIATPSTIAAATSTPTSTQPVFTPPGFHPLPTAKPVIVGPSGPPPNY
jgi:hypothetical protein